MKTGAYLAGFALSVVIGIAAAQSAPPGAAKLYSQRCAACHGDDATGTDRGPALARSRHLRPRSVGEIYDIIQKGTPAGMPPFQLPEDQLQALAAFVRSMNASAFDAPPQGDIAAGERFFFGKGQCASCHTALGRGKSLGPGSEQCRPPVYTPRTHAQTHESQPAGIERLCRSQRPLAERQYRPRVRT